MHIIEKKGRSNSGQLLYSMESVELAFIAAFLYSYDEVIKWKSVFVRIKLEMDEEAENLKQLSGYAVVYRMINMILSSIAIYDQLLKMFKEESFALEKKK
jgi:hypothetical protein